MSEHGSEQDWHRTVSGPDFDVYERTTGYVCDDCGWSTGTPSTFYAHFCDCGECPVYCICGDI